MLGQPVDKDVADYFLLRSVAVLTDDEEEVDAGELFQHFKDNFHAARDWNTSKIGKRLLILEEHGFVIVKSPGRGMITHEDGPTGMVEITSAGEQALKQPPGRFKGRVGNSITDRSVNFNAPVTAGSVATGDYSQQTVNVTLTLGDLLKAVGQAIEENPESTPEEKEAAKAYVDKIKENLPHAAQLCTVSNAVYGLINAGLSLLS